MIGIAVRIQTFLQTLAQSLVSLIRIAFLSKLWVKIPSVKTKTQCVVLGNGPSLTQSLQQHQAFIGNCDAFAVNMFANTLYFQSIQPRFYVILAPELWEEHAPQPMLNEQISLFTNIAKATWDLFVFAPSFAKNTQFWKQYFAQVKEGVTLE